MNSARRKTIHVLVAVFMAAVMIAVMAMPALAQQGPQIQLTDDEDYADCPDVAIDSQGNVHIAVERNFGSNYGEIWYTMLDNNGNTLIDDTLICDTNTERKPAIGVDSQDKVHIVWQGSSGYQITYIKLAPYLDGRDGDAATLAFITEVARTVLYGYYERQQDPRLAIDSNDNVHVVWGNWPDSEIAYMQLNSSGGVVVAYTVVADISLPVQNRPFVAVDSNDNPHIVWNDNMGTSTDETFYAMLSGVDGSHLIDATLITLDDGWQSQRSDVVVDDEDMVHVFWSDERDTVGQEIYCTKLDPSLDDQDGDPADESSITVIDDTRLTSYDNLTSSVPQAAFQCGYIHVTWKDAHWAGGTPPKDVFYMVLGTDGNIIVPETALTTGSTLGHTHSYADNVIPVAVDSNGKAHTAWCDDRAGDEEIWYTTYQGPPCPTPTPPPVGGEAHPVGKMSVLAPWIAVGLVLAGGIGWYVLRRRRVQN